MPGKTPASAAPKKKRRVVRVEKFLEPAIPAQKAPKQMTMMPSHLRHINIGTQISDLRVVTLVERSTSWPGYLVLRKESRPRERP